MPWRWIQPGLAPSLYTSFALVLLAGTGLLAAETGSVVWHRDVRTAWQSTQQQGRPLLVFVTTEHCMYCTKMKRATYANPKVASTINRSFVPLVLDGEAASPLLKDLAVKGFPATFIISQDAIILDRMDGFVDPEKLMARLAAAQASAAVQPPARDY
jgi:thioredoxin-related protein